jgi:ferritin-like protein
MGYFEPASELSGADRDVSRALNSLKEEIEAIDYYHQRGAVASDPELAAIVIHNRDEEIEHAAMCLEWLRRHIPVFDKALRTYLFTTAPVTEVEAAADGAESDAARGLGLGSLKDR